MLLPDIALKNSITLLFLSFFLFISCDHKHKEYAKGVLFYSGFPHERELIGEVIELDTALLRYPFRIRIEGDRAIVMDLHGLDHYGHLFQYPGFQYLSSFGKRGDSPTEMLSMENFRLQNHVVWTLDANKSELTRLDFSSSGDSLLRDETVTLDEDILRPLDFAIYNDSMFIIPDYSGENRLCRVNRNGRLIDKIGIIPTIDEKALERILTEPKNALIKQYKKLFELDGVELKFTDEAINTIAKKAVERKTGARGLRAILENAVMDIMYETPSDETIKECIVNEDVINGLADPELVYNSVIGKKKAKKNKDKTA